MARMEMDCNLKKKFFLYILKKILKRLNTVSSSFKESLNSFFSDSKSNFALEERFLDKYLN